MVHAFQNLIFVLLNLIYFNKNRFVRPDNIVINSEIISLGGLKAKILSNSVICSFMAAILFLLQEQIPEDVQT